MSLTRPLRILDPDRFDLSRLTAAESLWTWRHRQLTTTGRVLGRAGRAMSQEEAASRLGLSVSAYAALELGYATALRADEVMSLIGPLGPLNPTVGELCVLARRRSGENVHQVTEAIGYSRVSYFRFERDGDPRVVSFWEDRGFRFPQARAVGAVPEGRPGTVPYRAKS